MSATQAQQDFIARVGALAAADMKRSGVLASLTLAQAILESGWGMSALTVKANALFGIKADSHWSGRVYSSSTKECYDGVNFTTVTALFRAYDSWEHSAADHSAFLTGSTRYAAVIGERDYEKACGAIHKAGYATDPGYATKLISLIEAYGLTLFDSMGEFDGFSEEEQSKRQRINLHKLIFVNNDCYKAGRTIIPKGILVHSTGANNPFLKRYVGPDDGLLGKNVYVNHWNRPMDRQVCVHAFIGKLEDGSVATYQTLPWNMRGWHSGSGPKGNGNDTLIGFEICEDGLTNAAYFQSVFNEAVGLCVYLCAMFGLNPMRDGVLLGHYEAYLRGIASNHADPGHWFKKFGESMEGFRAAVKRRMDTGIPAPPEPMPESKAPTRTPVNPEAPDHEVYTVAKGDSLWKIAAEKLGSGVRCVEIKKLNALISDTIYAGQKLKIPMK